MSDEHQLQCVNKKIAALAAVTPWADVFSRAAHLAAEAITATEELQRLPGANVEQIEPAREFWFRVRDCNHWAARAVAGENQSLGAALVVFRFLRKEG